MLALIALGVLVWRWSGRIGWGDRHVLAVAAAPLLVNVAMAFFIQPLGSPDPVIKYAVNSALALGVAVLLLVAARRVRSSDSNTLSSAGTPVAEGARPD